MFTSRFREIIQNRNITAYRIAKDTGISQGLMAEYNRGEKIPTVNNLTKIADYLDCSVDYLLGRTEIQKNPSAEAVGGVSEKLLNACQRLNEAGQERVALYAEDLAASGRYQKTYHLSVAARGGVTVDPQQPVDEEALEKANTAHPPVYDPEL